MFSFTQEEKERFELVFMRSGLIPIEFCAYHNNLQGINWLREHGDGWPPDTIAAAVIGGHFELVRWLRQEGCWWNEQTMYDVLNEGDITGAE